MQTALRCASLGIVLLFFLALSRQVAGQEIDLSGRAYVDYFYTLSSPDEGEENLHGFTYRRLYLTSDFVLSEDFLGRARLEANDGTVGPKGPEPYVKDLWLAWSYSGDHAIRLGVMPPPVFEVAEDVWGYRSLEKTILDFQGVNSSRDFGLQFSGPISSDIRYSLMVANNEAVNPEVDPYKRAYGQLEFYPTEHLAFTLGADRAGYGGPREGGTRVSAFGGYVSDAFNVGLELYWHEITFEIGDELQSRGASLFGHVSIAPSWELVGRVDAVSESLGDADVRETFLLLGAAYEPIEAVRIIPNLWLFGNDELDDDEMLARMTVEIIF